MMPFWKTLTFWISACSWFIVLGGHYVGVIPSPYGLVLGNVVVLIYGIMRCLQKRQAGTPWKGILFTSEFVGTSATMLVNLLDALKEIPALPPKILVALAAASGLLVTILHQLSVSGVVGAVGTSAAGTSAAGTVGTAGAIPAIKLGPLAPESGAPVRSQPEAITEPVRSEDIVATTPDLVNPKTKKE